MVNKKSVYGILLIIIIILYVLFQNTFFGMIFFIFLLMGAISVLIARTLSKAVEVRLECNTKEISINSEIKFDIIVNNRTWFPTNKLYVNLLVRNYFFTEETDSCVVGVPVTINGEEKVSSSITCNYVGNVRLSLKDAKISDYLGIVSYDISLEQNVDIEVFPSQRDIKVKMIGNAAMDDDGNSDAIDSMEAYDIKEVREYKDGESLHRIHWNLSSRFDELMIKEYEVETVPRFNIMIDLAKETMSCINELMEALCSAINLVMNLEKEFNVYWYDDKSEQVRHRTIVDSLDVRKLLDDIYAVGMADKTGQVYYNIDMNMDEMVNVIYITADRDSVNGEIIGEIDNKVVLMCI